MYSSNQKISNTQIKKLLIFDILSITIIILPSIAAGGAGRDGLLAIVLGSVMALIYSSFFIYLTKKIKEDFIEFSKKTVGKLLTFLIGLLYISKIFFSGWFSIALFSKVINDTLLPDTNIKIIIFLLILVSMYAAGNGIEVRARIAQVLFYIVITPLIFLMAFGLKRVDFTNLFPLFMESNKDIFNTSYLVLLCYSVIESLIFATPFLRDSSDKKDCGKNIIQSVLFCSIMNIVFFILVLGLLGLNGATKQFKASIMIMQLIQIPGGFVQRQDAFMLTIWMISIFTILSAYFYYLTNISNSLINIKKKYCYLLFWGILLFGLSFIKIPLETLFLCYGKYMAYIGFPQSICIPLFVIIISKFRREKGGAYEQGNKE